MPFDDNLMATRALDQEDEVASCTLSGTTLKDRIPKLENPRRRPEVVNPTPVPETPTLPQPPHITSNWTFHTPKRRILSHRDHALFQASSDSTLIQAWIFGLADAVIDTPCSSVKETDISQTARGILALLDEAETILASCPPHEQGGSRFGNAAFRTFIDLVVQSSARWHRSLGVDDADAASEVSTYLTCSFGDRSRIDYGSGHELNFAIWLLCLYQLGLIHQSDFRALVLRVFSRYISLMRKVQMTYYLEPAGSHGVWGLDDYQFLPFLFGAAQLLHHPYITPRAVHQELTIEEFGSDYLYLGQVAFVNSTKTVKGLRWHSPMLDDISSAKSWSKIDGGMRRMFVAEVLGKLPVMQHFLFGSLVPAADGMSDEMHQPTDTEHSNDKEVCMDKHNGTGWGECCGIKVPSGIAAAEELKKKGGVKSLRRIPFD